MGSEGTQNESAVRTAAQFATTHWSVVLAAGDSASLDSKEALEQLCQQYWFPLYSFARRFGCQPEDAKDITQGFIERLIAQRSVKDVIRERGRFRTFLLTLFKRFLINEREREKTLKRGGNLVFVPLEAEWMEGAYREDSREVDTPERAYDRAWARTVMDGALRRLEADLRAAGQTRVYEELSPFLSSPADAGEYAQVAERLKMNPHAVAAAVERLRRRFRDLVRQEIGHTVPTVREFVR